MKTISKDLAAAWAGNANNAIEPVYVQDAKETPTAFADGEYEVRQLRTKDGRTPSIIDVTTKLGKFSFFVKGNKAINEDAGIRVAKFVASREFPCSNGTVVPKGKIAYMVTQ